MITQEEYNFAISYSDYIEEFTNSIYAKFTSFSEEEQEYFIDIISDLQDIDVELHKIKTIYENQASNQIRNQDYRIVDGDSLVSIANKFYGIPEKWEEIFKANKLTDLALTVGDILIIPTVG